MKGLAIICVVLGHCTCDPVNNSFYESFVNQFHLAVFFFVSGYFFKEKYIINKFDFVKRKFKSLYIPYIISGIVFMLLHPLLFNLHLYNESLSISELPSQIFNLCIRLSSNDQLMGAMWFCPALLFVSIYSLFIFILTKNMSSWKRTLCFIIISFMGGGHNTLFYRY